MDNQIPFRPYQGYDKIIQAQDIVDGNIYFAADSGKIYLDKEGSRIAMGGGGAAVLYAQASNIIANPDDTYTIKLMDLQEGSSTPKENDLIINSDGRFFKVSSVDTVGEIVRCTLIAVSGTGGGPGNTPGDGPDSETDERVIDVKWHDVTYSFVAGSPYYITFTATSKLDKYLNVEYQVQTTAGIVETKTIQVQSGEKKSVEVGSKMSTSGYNAVHFTIMGANSYTYTDSIKRIKAIDFRLEQDNTAFSNYRIYTDIVPYAITAFGEVSKTLYVQVDNQVPQEYLLGTNKVSKTVDINCVDLLLAPGVHTLTSYLMAEGIKSNIVVTDFVYHPDNAPHATYVLITEYPSEVYSYDIPLVKYWVYNTGKQSGESNDISLYVNNTCVDTVSYVQNTGTNAGLSWKVTGLREGINELRIESNASRRAFTMNVVKDTLFDPTTDGAVLMLSADGRSNGTSLERRLDWKYTYGQTTIAAQLNGFNWYNNGWTTDALGRNCLRINNGASVSIPMELFTDSKPTEGGFTIEFEFKPYNLFSYQLLTQTSSSGEDESVRIERVCDSSKAIIKYVEGEGTAAYGYCLGTQDAYFRLGDGSNVAVRYKDDEIINIAMVVDAYRAQMFIYINGVMSGMTSFIPSPGLLPLHANTIQINSEYCDIDLYNIRIYNKVLKSADIVQNYISSKKDKELAAANNKELSTGETVDLNQLIAYNSDHPDNPTIPYAVITTSAEADILPFKKTNADVIVDIDFTNPTLDYKYSLGEYTEEEYKKKVPSFKATKVVLNVQGTSSQKYPRKNFKAKFLKGSGTLECSNEKITDKTLKKLFLDSDIGEKTFTWKADYMDSSGTHNTGFASFVKLLYNKHPLDYYEGTDGVYHAKYRTTIYGFPMLVFHKNSKGEVEFIGKYNFNLDKGCDDTLGFTDGGTNKVLNKPYEDIAECWEFGNNQGGRCSFRGAPFDDGYNYETQTGKLNLWDDIEVRYHKNGDAIEQAFNLLAEDEKTPITPKEAFDIILGGDEAGHHPNGYGNLERLFLWLQSANFLFDLTKEEDQEYVKAELGRSDTVLATDTDYQAFVTNRKTKFTSEFTKHFNLDYCLVYYIMTELLIQYDSRGKNMMLGSWGPMEEGGEYIWFPMYYDIDTQLGVDNSGVPSWEYNVEPSAQKHFSTSNSILWTCFDAAYQNRIQTEYKTLRGNNLKIDTLNGYYNFDPTVSKSEAMAGILPISFINADQYYKYIAPAITGYIGPDKNDNPTTLYSSGYYYCLQGTRDLHRALFLRNRFNYEDSKLQAGAYDPTDSNSAMRIRITEITNQGELNTLEQVTLTPQLDQYVSVWADESASKIITKKASAGVPVTLEFDPNNELTDYDKQLLYFGGPGYLTDFGDLSLLYINELDSTGGFPTSVVTSIVLGNENDNYDNPEIINNQVQSINSVPKTLLKNFDLTNLRVLNGTLPIDTAEKLETFKALGTNLSAVEFAPGVALRRLYLPESTSKLELIEAAYLNKIVYNKSDILDENGKQTKEGLYIADVVHTHPVANIDVARLNQIKIVGDAFGSQSYELLNKITNAKIATQNYNGTIEGYDGNLAIDMEKVKWTPYTQLGEGAIYNTQTPDVYKYATNKFTYDPYVYTNEGKWNKDLSEGRIFKYDSGVVHNITDLSLLDKYIDDNKQHFTNITTTLNKGMPIITGEMYINNTTPISEYDIANKYNALGNFSDLTIRVANVSEAYRARFIRAEKDGTETELVTYRYANENDTIIPPALENIDVPVHHDFVGWKNVDTGEVYDIDAEFEALSFSDSKREYVFELVYKKHEYVITFKDKFTDFSEDVKVEYDSNLRLPIGIPYRDDSALEDTQCYAFKGWTTKEPDEELPEQIVIENVTDRKADMDMTYYAVFALGNVYDNVASPDLFDIVKPSGVNYYQIRLKADNQLKGKITLPAKTADGEIIESIGYFTNHQGITHIFFEKGNSYKYIAASTFSASNNKNISLKCIYLPEGLESIGNYAFNGLTTLITIGENNKLPAGLKSIGDSAFARLIGGTINLQVHIDELPEGLTSIGGSAFSFAGDNIRITKLPINIEILPAYVFQCCKNVSINEFGSDPGVAGGSKLRDIGTGAFYMTGTSGGTNKNIENLYIYKSIDKLVARTTIAGGTNYFGSFESYGPSTMKVYSTHAPGDKDWNYAGIGFPSEIEFGFVPET